MNSLRRVSSDGREEGVEFHVDDDHKARITMMVFVCLGDMYLYLPHAMHGL